MFARFVLSSIAVLLVSVPQIAKSEVAIATLDGNDCAGLFGKPFDACKIPTKYDPNQSPVIAKYDTGVDEGSTKGWEFNSEQFPSVTADDFNLTINEDGSGSFVYLKDNDDPVITFFVAKGGPLFNLFKNDDEMLAGTWTTPVNDNNNKTFELSHITFYDTGGGIPPSEVPEPTTLLLTGLALAGLSLSRKRRHA
jgi:hypothetical protein